MPGNANSGGQNAKTIARLKAQETFREARHSGFHNMEHVPGDPDVPKDLSGDSLEEWQRMVERLRSAKSLSKIDDAAIYQYAKLFAETKATEKRVNVLTKNIDKLVALSNRLEDRDLVEAMRNISSMEKTLVGYVSMLRQGRMAIRQYLVEFGMTSSARGRIKMPGESTDRPSGKLMSFRGGKT